MDDNVWHENHHSPNSLPGIGAPPDGHIYERTLQGHVTRVFRTNAKKGDDLRGCRYDCYVYGCLPAYGPKRQSADSFDG